MNKRAEALEWCEMSEKQRDMNIWLGFRQVGVSVIDCSGKSLLNCECQQWVWITGEGFDEEPSERLKICAGLWIYTIRSCVVYQGY